MSSLFYPVRQYIAARGPQYDEDGESPRYKLCVVATDLNYLVEFLTKSVTRADGYYVKYSDQPKDGMYLGRVYLASEEAVGTLWAETKDDPKLLASVQDDHFIMKHRSAESLALARQVGE